MVRLGLVIGLSAALLGCKKEKKTDAPPPAAPAPAPAAAPVATPDNPAPPDKVAVAGSPDADPAGWERHDLSKLTPPTESVMGGKVLPHAPWALSIATPAGAELSIGDDSNKYEPDGHQNVSIKVGTLELAVTDAAKLTTLAAFTDFSKNWGPVEQSAELPDGGYLLVRKGPAYFAVTEQLHKPAIECGSGTVTGQADMETAVKICRSLRAQ